ncbi:MAG: aldo/keto reductase [Bacteroidetes bacterium]|nr:aldo/keto reductase [Bacteroidota bacterium]
MSWGVWGADFSTREIAFRIEQNAEIGVTSFDQADIYGNYTTEATFGEALTQSTVRREEVQLISKCGIQLINPERNSRVKHYDYRASYIIQQAEQSLKNLQTDYLDLFLLHRPSPLMQREEIAKAVHQLKQAGKIRAFGVSNFTPAQMRYLGSELDIFANQIECSLTHSDPMENDTLFFHQKHEIQTQAWSPLGSALQLDPAKPLAGTLNQLAEKYSCSTAQLLIAWLLGHPAQLHPVLGTTKTDHLRKAVASQYIELDRQDWFVLYEAARGREVD